MSAKDTLGIIEKLGLLSIVVLLCLLGSEAFLRLVWDNPYAQEKSSRFVELRLNHANQVRAIQRQEIDAEYPVVRFATDERSYILPSFKPENSQKRIVFFGASTTESRAVQENLRFPYRVGEILQDKGLAVETRNIGCSGNVTLDSTNILINHVVNDAPDVAVIMHAANEQGVLYQFGDYGTRMSRHADSNILKRWALQLGKSGSSLLALLKKVSDVNFARPGEINDWRKTIDDSAPINVEIFKKQLKAFIGAAKGLGVKPVVMTQPLQGITNHLTPGWASKSEQDRFNKAIREVASETEISLIDLAQRMRVLPEWDESDKIFYDGMHVTDFGSKLYAQIIGERLEQILNENDETQGSVESQE